MILTLKVGPAYAKRFEKRRAAIAGSDGAFLGFIHSHISAEAVHDRVLFLSRAYREFYYAEKVSPEYTG